MALTKQQCDEFWRLADTDRNGSLTIQEVRNACRKYDRNLKDKDIASMFCTIDGDDNGRISQTEFTNEMLNKTRRATSLQQCWQKYDVDRNGTLSRGEVMKIIEENFPEKSKNRIIGEFLEFCDLDGNGIITRKEFDDFFCA
ncbi:calmodulin-2-like [Ruditapes philippinarum]|uniref:calmodulin-2-like n=1 Tax=Ruditapes philippinarum TaxID=129788 RepID=UPI00295AABDE|nr:calmodulin-2-like [Ruditapes philippinarum]